MPVLNPIAFNSGDLTRQLSEQIIVDLERDETKKKGSLNIDFESKVAYTLYLSTGSGHH